MDVVLARSDVNCPWSVVPGPAPLVEIDNYHVPCLRNAQFFLTLKIRNCEIVLRNVIPFGAVCHSCAHLAIITEMRSVRAFVRISNVNRGVAESDISLGLRRPTFNCHRKI